MLTLLVGLSLLAIDALISVILNANLYFTKIVLLGVFLLGLLFFWKRYGNNDYVKGLDKRYKDEELNAKRLRGWLFVGYLIFILIIPISVGFIRHNLGMDI